MRLPVFQGDIVGFILKPSISKIVKNRDICTIGQRDS